MSYIGWNALLFIPGAILFFVYSLGQQALALSILGVLFGGASILTFFFRDMRKLGVSRGEAIRAFVVVILASNGAYLLFVLGYAKLIGAI